MSNPTCKKAGKVPANLNKARCYLFSIPPGSGSELLLLIVIGGLFLCL